MTCGLGQLQVILSFEIVSTMSVIGSGLMAMETSVTKALTS